MTPHPRHSPHSAKHGGHAPVQATRAVDPVCGMDVTPGDAAGGFLEHAGQTYWFCSPSCRQKFVANPEHYVNPPRKTTPAPSADDRIYTCPMHPEVRQKGPGNCPKCGMALEP